MKKLTKAMIEQIEARMAGSEGKVLTSQAGNALESLIYLLPHCSRMIGRVEKIEELVVSNPEFECDKEALQDAIHGNLQVIIDATAEIDDAMANIRSMYHGFLEYPDNGQTL